VDASDELNISRNYDVDVDVNLHEYVHVQVRIHVHVDEHEHLHVQALCTCHVHVYTVFVSMFMLLEFFKYWRFQAFFMAFAFVLNRNSTLKSNDLQTHLKVNDLDR
jgi:hypothetical protein